MYSTFYSDCKLEVASNPGLPRTREKKHLLVSAGFEAKLEGCSNLWGCYMYVHVMLKLCLTFELPSVPLPA